VTQPHHDGDQHEPLVERPTTGRIFDARRRVRLADSSPAGRLRLDAAARYLQDIANDDSRDAGSPNPTAWVARRTVMRIEHFPEYLDQLSLSTWCSGLGPRWAERRYSVVADAPSGGRIEAATLWVHIDMATMKPVPVPAGFAEQFAEAAHGRTVKARLHLPPRPPAPDERVGQPVQEVVWPLRFVDFDVLGHVNNSVYWAMVEEQLAARRALRAPVTLTLEHHDGIDPGDDVRVDVRDTATGFDLWVTTTTGKNTAVVRVTAP
jgi:acyl-ACP thioesterase